MQKKVGAFLRDHALSVDPLVRMVDLASETGELGKALLESSRYGSAAVTPTDAIRMEIGDCLFALLALSQGLDVDAEATLEATLAKYSARIAGTGIPSSGPA